MKYYKGSDILFLIVTVVLLVLGILFVLIFVKQA